MGTGVMMVAPPASTMDLLLLDMPLRSRPTQVKTGRITWTVDVAIVEILCRSTAHFDIRLRFVFVAFGRIHDAAQIVAAFVLDGAELIFIQRRNYTTINHLPV